MPPKTAATKSAKNVDSSSQPLKKEIDVIQPSPPAENVTFSANQVHQIVAIIRQVLAEEKEAEKIDKKVDK